MKITLRFQTFKVSFFLFCWISFSFLPGTLALRSILRRAVEDGVDLNASAKPLVELVSIVNFIKANQPQELKDFLTKAPCENKVQYRGYLRDSDPEKLMLNVKLSSFLSLILVSMFDCPIEVVYGAQARILLRTLGVMNIRDITEVMVTVSQTAELHEAFIKAFEAESRYGVGNLGDTLENQEDISLDGDIENVCFELKDRKRAPAAPYNAPDAAQKLFDEMGKWDDEREEADKIMMETPIDKLPAVLDEFKKLNGGKSLEQAFSDKFQNDVNKLNVYTQLAQLGADKYAYLATGIQNRLTSPDNEYRLPLANAITVLGSLEKEDRKKVEDQYKNLFNIGLMEQMDQLAGTMNLEDIILKVMKLYMDDLKKN